MTAALQFGAERIAPTEIERRATCGAAGLERAGVREDDVVALMLHNEPAHLEAILAARRLGAYSCPINWHYKADEAGFILRDSGAKVLVASPVLLAQIGGAVPPGVTVIDDWAGWRDAHAPWTGAPRPPRGNMPYTSGTTGRPKGVRRAPTTEAQRRLAAELYKTVLGIRPDMRALVAAPLYHSAPNLYGVQVLLAGELLVLEPRFDAERTLALVERHRLTDLYLVPTMYVRLLRLPPEARRRYDLSSVRFVSSTGSPCAPEVKRAMIEWWGPVFTETYASSEAGHITFIDSHEWLRRPGSAGRPVGAGRVKILDDDGRELPPGEVGLIYARQPAYPDFTYTNNPAARGAIERDGLWSVGDMGYLDADGYLYVADRKSDMVISGGVNIYPAEIESVLLTLPGVADCAVFGIPDAEFGEALAAAVQPRPGAHLTADDIRTKLRERIAGYKVPRVVTFHDALPREDSGKIFKRLLREPYWREAGRRI
ncbi:MAG TPA: AMP-binding protein [Burkholderiales bacterium]|nr:AMP-binding protein [Burkholderiales bacterium]